MDTLKLQRLILATDLMPTEKLVGMALALHMNVKAGHIRMKQETIAKECGFSRRTVVRAVLALVTAGVFESRRTGRTAILVPAESSAGASVKSSVNVEVTPVSHQKCHPCHIRQQKESDLWDCPPTSTPAEELYKREVARAAKTALRHARTSQRAGAP